MCSQSWGPTLRKAAQEGKAACCCDCTPCPDNEISYETDKCRLTENFPTCPQESAIPKQMEKDYKEVRDRLFFLDWEFKYRC